MQNFSLYNPFDFNDPVAYAVPGFILLIVLEFTLYVRKKLKPDEAYYKDAAASIGMGLGSIFIDIAMKAVALGYLFWFYQFRIFENLGPDTVQDFLTMSWHKSHIWVWIVCLFFQDFAFYWHHRLSHEIRLLWTAHINHHSSTNLNLAVALRQSWLELLYKDMWYIPLAIIGFHPFMILTLHQLNLIYQFWTHTEVIKKFPKWFEAIFNTPSHHRVHHASNIKYLDKNYAGTFIIWDKLFGTFREEDEEKPVYGITKNIQSYNLFEIAFHEWRNMMRDVRQAPNFKSKLHYLFSSPGWSHDGEDQRAKTLQKNLK
jgi:sterol desaturase/sphingolipid hydroxylase (fatty acid hydroxylase superfamily)